MPGDAAATRNQEANLIDLVGRISRNPSGRAAVHVHLSMLRPHNRRDHHLRIAREVMGDQIQTFSGQVFSLANGDIVFVCKWADRESIDRAVGKLRHLFHTDPLSRDAGGDGSAKFSTWYDLELEAEALVAALNGLDEPGDREERPEGPQRTLRPLDPHVLDQVEKALKQADLSMLVRRQWVCAMMPRLPAPEPILQEYFVAISELQQRVLPDFDLLSNRYLFQHLTETLDRRMLSMLARAGEPKEGLRISVNLNVSTVLSPEFHTFDQRLNSATRGATAFELQVSDVFADLADFTFVRDYLQAKGYRVAIDGVTHLTLPFLDRERLNVDLMKIYWSSDLADYLDGENAEWMRDFVERAGPGRVILCRVDDEDAIRIGNTFGIQLFQGRHIDAVLEATRQERLEAEQQKHQLAARHAAALR